MKSMKKFINFISKIANMDGSEVLKSGDHRKQKGLESASLKKE